MKLQICKSLKKRGGESPPRPYYGQENKCLLTHYNINFLMIKLERCKKLLNKGVRKYTENEIKEIRSYLYFIGGLQIENNENKIYKQ